MIELTSLSLVFMWDFILTPFSNNMRYSPRSAMAALENFFIGGFEKAIGHFVAVAVRLGQIHQINLLFGIAIAVSWSEARYDLRERKV